jgi:hypothetical protein
MSLLVDDERLSRKVGGLALLMLACAIAFVVFVSHRVEWSGHVRIRVYFRHTAGLREGAAVVVGGKSIGSVESIVPSPHGADTPLGGDEGVVVTVAIAADMASRVMRGGDIFVASRGPLGERYLEIGPSPVPTSTLSEGREQDNRFRGRDPVSLDRILQKLWDGLSLERQLAEAVRPELATLRARLAELDATLDSLAANAGDPTSFGPTSRDLLDEVHQLREVGVGGDAGLARIGEVLARAGTTFHRARAMMIVLEPKLRNLVGGDDAARKRMWTRALAGLGAVEAAIDRMRDTIAKLDPLTAHIGEISGRLARGDGTVGRLMNDLELSDDVKELTRVLIRQPWRILAGPQDWKAAAQKPGVSSGPDD